jgi:hypothetical protein
MPAVVLLLTERTLGEAAPRADDVGASRSAVLRRLSARAARSLARQPAGEPSELHGAAHRAWAIDNNLTQKVSGGDPVQVAMLKGLVAGAVNIGIALALGTRLPGAGISAAAMVLVLASYGVSLVLFVLALRQLGTARTGAYFSLAPFVGAGVSIAIFRERPTAFFPGGAAPMAVSVWLHLAERHEHAHVHDAHHQHWHAIGNPPVTDPVPHAHQHHHAPMTHEHAHYSDLHHRHGHEGA